MHAHIHLYVYVYTYRALANFWENLPGHHVCHGGYKRKNIIKIWLKKSGWPPRVPRWLQTQKYNKNIIKKIRQATTCATVATTPRWVSETGSTGPLSRAAPCAALWTGATGCFLRSIFCVFVCIRCLSLCVYWYICILAYIYMYVCMYIYVYFYIYILLYNMYI